MLSVTGGSVTKGVVGKIPCPLLFGFVGMREAGNSSVRQIVNFRREKISTSQSSCPSDAPVQYDKLVFCRKNMKGKM